MRVEDILYNNEARRANGDASRILIRRNSPVGDGTLTEQQFNVNDNFPRSSKLSGSLRWRDARGSVCLTTNSDRWSARVPQRPYDKRDR
jgi:hypothetical protein